MGANRVRVLRPSPDKTSVCFDGVLTGKVTGLLQGGMPLVEVPGRDAALIARRCLQQFAPAAGQGAPVGIGSQVLIVCENGDPEQAILIGVVAKMEASCDAAHAASADAPRRSARIDGESVVLEAESEIVLRCGKGSLTLTADGRIVLKGVEITSRALRQHKIKGGTVNIN
jgi:hypothetical protein